MSERREFDNPSWLTADQTAERLSIPLATLSIWRNQGAGPPWLEIEHEVWYDEADLLHWMGTNGLA